MKPIVGALNAWTCVVISVFAIVILSILGALFSSDNRNLMGEEESPKDHSAAATATFGAVFVYVGFLVFCGFQALLHWREGRRGQIALS